MKKYLFCFHLLVAASVVTQAQNTFPSTGSVGIGTTAPANSSLLEVKSTTKGMLLPRMTAAQRGAIASPAQGLLVFQTDGTKGFYYYDGGWKVVTPSTSSFAAKSLNNLTSPTAVNQHLLPKTTKAYDLGSSSLSWRNLYLRDDIYLDGTRFVSNAPGTGNTNAFVGSYAGLSITTGYGNTALGNNALRTATNSSGNTAVGASVLYSNNGSYNTAVGDSAMYAANSDNNTAVGFMTLSKTMQTGSANTAIGHEALANNTSGDNNTALGRGVLRNNNSGYLNTAAGSFAMYQSVSGTQNVAIGRLSLAVNNGSSNTVVGNESMAANNNGSFNTAMGYRTLQNTYGSQFNTVIGYLTGAKYDNGYNNVFLGANSDVNGPGYYNVIAIGQGTICTAPSQVTIGNPATNSYRIYGGWSNISDGRYKRNLQENVPGLSFINKLRPVTYTLDATGLDRFLNNDRNNREQLSPEAEAVKRKALTQKEAIMQTGFVAQEVEKAAKEVKYDFSGVHKPVNDKDVYGLSYAEFVVPLVKAVQELDVENKKKDEKIASLEQRLQKLEALLRGGNYASPNVSAAYLEQATPNPVRSATLIRYGIPDGGATAKLTLANVKGQVLKEINLVNRGTGQVNLNTTALPAGMYTYTLWVDGKQADSKQLVITK